MHNQSYITSVSLCFSLSISRCFAALIFQSQLSLNSLLKFVIIEQDSVGVWLVLDTGTSWPTGIMDISLPLELLESISVCMFWATGKLPETV